MRQASPKNHLAVNFFAPTINQLQWLVVSIFPPRVVNRESAGSCIPSLMFTVSVCKKAIEIRSR